MTVTVIREQEVLREAVDVLWEHEQDDNGMSSQAEGPLCFDKGYFGRPEHQDDWDSL